MARKSAELGSRNGAQLFVCTVHRRLKLRGRWHGGMGSRRATRAVHKHAGMVRVATAHWSARNGQIPDAKTAHAATAARARNGGDMQRMPGDVHAGRGAGVRVVSEHDRVTTAAVLTTIEG